MTFPPLRTVFAQFYIHFGKVNKLYQSIMH